MSSRDRPEGLWRRMRERLRPAPLKTAEALRVFLQERASLIAQKCAVDYCRGKTGLASHALFTEAPFLDALDVCRWETFVAVLGDLTLVAEGRLRAHVPPDRRARLHAALRTMHAATLEGLPPPAHRTDSWGDAIAAFASRLEAAALGEPRQALDVADHSARRLFDTLPIHISLRKFDEEVVFGAVRFRMVAVSQEMERRLRGAEMADQLLDVRT
jgi:hypothetical protein